MISIVEKDTSHEILVLPIYNIYFDCVTCTPIYFKVALKKFSDLEILNKNTWKI